MDGDGGMLQAQGFESLLKDLQQRHIMVLVTSRKSVAVSLGMVEPLVLGALPVKSSVQLLMDLAGSGISWERDDAAELVGICGRNALAITILAGLLKSKYCTPTVRAVSDLIRGSGARLWEIHSASIRMSLMGRARSDTQATKSNRTVLCKLAAIGICHVT